MLCAGSRDFDVVGVRAQKLQTHSSLQESLNPSQFARLRRLLHSDVFHRVNLPRRWAKRRCRRLCCAIRAHYRSIPAVRQYQLGIYLILLRLKRCARHSGEHGWRADFLWHMHVHFRESARNGLQGAFMGHSFDVFGQVYVRLDLPVLQTVLLYVF